MPAWYKEGLHIRLYKIEIDLLRGFVKLRLTFA